MNPSASINKDKSKSPFIKVDRGVYALRNAKSVPATARIEEADEAKETARETGLNNAFGMFWDRIRVQWKPSMPSLLDVQQSGSEPVNFADQAGVYVLYDGSRQVADSEQGPMAGDTDNNQSNIWFKISYRGGYGFLPSGLVPDLSGCVPNC